MASHIQILVTLALCVSCVPQVAADKPAPKEAVKVEFRRAESKPAEGLKEATVAGTTDKVYLHKQADLTNKDIAKATEEPDLPGRPAIMFFFTKEGAKKMENLTEKHKGKPLAILVDGKVICAPIIQSKLSDRALITGLGTAEEVKKIVKGINGK